MKKSTKWSLAVVCFILGLLSVTQIKFYEAPKYTLYSMRNDQLVDLIQKLEEQRNSLIQEVNTLRDQITQYEESAVREKSVSAGVLKEMNRIKLWAGLVPVSGPGIVVTLDDSKKKVNSGANPENYLIHDYDLREIVNELWASGAEAIAINNQRIVVTSEIRCVGPTILVNGVRLSPPYVVKAIGDADSLISALTMPGGIISALNYISKEFGIILKLEKKSKVLLPSYEGAISLKYSKSEE
ncbi:MAG: DUF881 domain-containing protein [bacterium]